MLEIELKAACDDLPALKTKILERGASRLRAEVEEDIYFNHPARDFARSDEALRIRHAAGKFYLTYKGPKLGGPAKSRLEHQVEISSSEEATEILRRLGFSPIGTVRKKREFFSLGEATLCLDQVDGLGGFVEIEMLGKDKAAIEKKLLELAAGLGLSGFITSSYLELLLQIKGKSR